jgi:hypothetical protein
MLKIDLKKLPTGEWEDLRIAARSGEEILIRIAGTNPSKVRTQITGSTEIKVYRQNRNEGASDS